MKKQLGIFATFLAVGMLALFSTGCSSTSCEQPVCDRPCPPPCPMPCVAPCPTPCAPVCAPACKPACPPACAPACKPACAPVCPPACKPACPPACAPQPVCAPACPVEPLCKIPGRCKHPSSNKLNCVNGINVFAKNPDTCMLGDQYPLEFTIEACDDVCDVVVNATLPDGVTFIKSTPPAKVEGKRLTWNIGGMSKCQVINAKVFLKCECEGEQCMCFCATATPVRFCSLLCAKPRLVCQKCGPEQVCPGDAVHYTVTVTNRGSCAAEGVVVTDNVPPGLEHASGQRTVVAQLGTLQPCETKKAEFCFTATQRGKTCNTVVVTACNADSVSCQACTCVCCCQVDLQKTGPQELLIGQNAEYTIVATNTGDVVLTDVVVSDTAPSSTSIVSAPGASINGNQAVWRLRDLKPGEKQTFKITLYTCVPGCFTDHVSLTNCQQCNACAEATTHWKGRPALNICLVSTENPVCVGEPTSYKLTVVNQGQEADTNVAVTIRFPDEIQPVASVGPTQGTVNGQTVTFAPVNTINARQTLEFRVDARAKKSGDARINAEITSDNIKTPITTQESTIVN